MLLNELRIDHKLKKPKRKGRGSGSGLGKTAGRGNKGDGQRSGNKKYAYFEGGQTPLHRRLPKKGFSNYPFKIVYQEVNVKDLNIFDDNTTVDLITMLEAGLIKNIYAPVKILGDGNLEKKLIVIADKFSKSAVEKIKNAGGEAKLFEETITDTE